MWLKIFIEAHVFLFMYIHLKKKRKSAVMVFLMQRIHLKQMMLCFLSCLIVISRREDRGFIWKWIFLLLPDVGLERNAFSSGACMSA